MITGASSTAVDFTHSSRKAWQPTGRSTTHSRCPVTTNSIASQLLNNGRFPERSHTGRRVKSPRFLEQPPPMPTSTVEQLEVTIKKLKSGKAPGRDNIHPEFVLHQSAKKTAWLCSFFASCFRRSKLCAVLPSWPSQLRKTPSRIDPSHCSGPVQDSGEVDRQTHRPSGGSHSFLGNKPASVVVNQRSTK